MGNRKYAGQNDGVGHAVAIKRENARHEKDSIGGRRKDCNYAVCLLTLTLSFNAVAGQLDTQIPAYRDDSFLAIMEVNIPAQPLAMSLKQFATSAGLSLAFDSNLGENKMAPAVQGRMSRKEALRRILAGSGLGADLAGSTAVISTQTSTESITTNVIPVRAKRFYEVGPLPGLGLTKEEIPGNVQSITAEEIKQSHSLSITDLMNRKLQSVTVNDYQGNPFQMDVQYRGFTAGPQIGTPQGLSVFFDGIRVNEPFGDVVNWDMIPMNALAGIDVFPGSNPIFGLNTLGGAFTMKTKDGFNHEGVDAEVLTGSYGRKQLQVSGGWNNGTIGLFGAGNFFLEDGWRENSPSRVNQAFGKASYRGEKLDLSLSTLLVKTDLVGNGLLPSEMYAQDRNSVFTSEDTTENTLGQFQLSSSYFVNDNFTVTGQVYRRNSKRHQVGADAFMDYDDDLLARRIPADTEQWTCLLDSHNQNGLPDYYVLTIENPMDGFDSDLFGNMFFLDSLGNPGMEGNPALLLAEQPDAFNKEMPAAVAQFFLTTFNQQRNYYQSALVDRRDISVTPGPVTDYSFDQPSYASMDFTSNVIKAGVGNSAVAAAQVFENWYYAVDENNVVSKNYVMFVSPRNNDNCTATRALDATNQGGAFSVEGPTPGSVKFVDGIGNGGPGVIQGTPTAVFTDNRIDQIVDGVSLQFNWNLEHHKFMVGASIDSASAEYNNTQQLGFLDANRNAFLAPDLAHPQFAGADIPLSNNDFSGTNTTKSLYFSETWSPVKDWNFSASGRYNETQAKNKVATRYGIGVFGVGDLVAYPDEFAICPNGDCTNVPTGYKTPDLTYVLDKAETEKFSYYSFNPSLGATWQARENLNVYANWAKGTRTPSVIELGCALDHSPTGIFASDGQGGLYEVPKSVVENRQCSLPTTLSGDPYLPQIKATTYDIGMRGRWGENLQWNLGAYQTDLKDDIYFVAVGSGQGFFDTVGKTRRRGIEAGLAGEAGKARFSLNYSLTDATFEDNFYMFSEDNSSSTYIPGIDMGIIRVKPGNRMPGVPLHNLNASVSYAVTPKWTVGLSAVVHSESYVRGNENNEHEVGVTQYRNIFVPGVGPTTVARQPTTNPGKVPGYATFNFQTSYQLSPEWTASLLVNNLFDKEYFTAGRLGRNPFSPSILGGIGPDGYNHNSSDWLSTNFIAPGAPRGVWLSLRYEFKPDR